MDSSWSSVLEPHADQISVLLNELEGDLSNQYLPLREHIFRALNLPRDKVKTIIIGQDPYPTLGMAEGLAFSVPGTIAIGKIPPSLRNIFTEYRSDLGYGQPTTGHLGGWVESGVLLLNRILTVSPGKPLSHKGKGWEEITDSILRSLVERDLPVIAWGKPAENAALRLGFCQIVASPHPSPLSAYRGFFGSQPFSRVNQILLSQQREPIDWHLT